MLGIMRSIMRSFSAASYYYFTPSRMGHGVRLTRD